MFTLQEIIEKATAVQSVHPEKESLDEIKAMIDDGFKDMTAAIAANHQQHLDAVMALLTALDRKP